MYCAYCVCTEVLIPVVVTETQYPRHRYTLLRDGLHHSILSLDGVCWRQQLTWLHTAIRQLYAADFASSAQPEVSAQPQVSACFPYWSAKFAVIDSVVWTDRHTDRQTDMYSLLKNSNKTPVTQTQTDKKIKSPASCVEQEWSLGRRRSTSGWNDRAQSNVPLALLQTHTHTQTHTHIQIHIHTEIHT